MNERQITRVLRWYPPRWRARYEAEMVALLEDTYGAAGRVPRRHQVALARAGLSERAREAGVFGSTSGLAERLRAGSFLVLIGWASCLVALAVFGKFSENWVAGTASTGHWPARAAYDAVVVSGALGCAVVLVAALAVAPAFLRLVRRGDWSVVRRPVRRALTAVGVAGFLFAGVLVWAHRLSASERNGGNPLYGAVFVLVSLAVVVALGCATAAAVSIGRRADLGPAVLRALGTAALGLTGLMLLVLAGTVTWWVAVVRHAPGVLERGIGNGIPFDSALVPPALLVSALLMVLGLGLGAWGSARIAGTLRRPPAPR